MMDALSASETLVNFYQTTCRNIPEGCHLHTRRFENLKFHLGKRYLGEGLKIVKDNKKYVQ
jgi:hypothetical protein